MFAATCRQNTCIHRQKHCVNQKPLTKNLHDMELLIAILVTLGYVTDVDSKKMSKDDVIKVIQQNDLKKDARIWGEESGDFIWGEESGDF